jgi:hypothetical protein
MKKDDSHPARKRSVKPKAAKPMAHAKSSAKPTDRLAGLSKKLRSLKIRIAESKRPVHQIQQFPEIIGHIREFSIPEELKYRDAPTYRALLQRLAAYFTEPVTPCLSLHFPLPEAAGQLIKGLHEWDEILDSMFEWATQELDAIAIAYVDVENLCEECRECIEFTRVCFPDEHADEYSSLPQLEKHRKRGRDHVCAIQDGTKVGPYRPMGSTPAGNQRFVQPLAATGTDHDLFRCGWVERFVCPDENSRFRTH